MQTEWSVDELKCFKVEFNDRNDARYGVSLSAEDILLSNEEWIQKLELERTLALEKRSQAEIYLTERTLEDRKRALNALQAEIKSLEEKLSKAKS